MYQLIIKNGVCLTTHGRQQVDIGIKEGKIAFIGNLSKEQAEKVVDATELFVLPGLVDTQVHFREPGLEHKEDLESGTRGAVLGGVTGVFEMPNTNPSTTTKEALQDKINRMQNRAWCNYSFYVGGTPDKGVDWHELEELPGCCGIKIFMGASTGNLLVEEDEALKRILEKTTKRVAIHSEDNFIMKERKEIAEKGKHPRYHHIWRNKESAISSTNRLLKIAREVDAKVHVLHVTTVEEMEILKQNKDIATVEILPQHLTFSEEDYETLGTRIQMNPPIRDKENRDGLWKYVNDGTVCATGSDHAPHTLEEKAKEYPNSPSGMTGVQTIIPVYLDHINKGKMTLEKLVELMAECLHTVWGVKNKGRISIGYDADFTIVNMDKEWICTDDQMASKSKWTPYHNTKFKGKATHTIVGGNVIMENDRLDHSLQGKVRTYKF
ncbi:MAG TPA: dihydroorotase [Alphaproteobacteria bacterium]|nr:dihydroorotase [Alphaproteobacteria bacterium]